MEPTLGRIVIYRSRTGNYDVPAIITATVHTLAEVGVKMWHETDGEKGVPPLSSEKHVHLAVLTPGIPGLRAAAQDFKTESPHGRQENVNGIYQEWDIEPADDPEAVAYGVIAGADNPFIVPGSWRWPERV